jgi:uncharacterized DUF497 family protein
MDEAIQFDWNQANLEHIARHEVTSQEIEQVFANGPRDLGYKDVDGEGRYTVIGHTDVLRVLLVVWTIRNESVRPITARQVMAKTRDRYFRAKERDL